MVLKLLKAFGKFNQAPVPSKYCPVVPLAKGVRFPFASVFNKRLPVPAQALFLNEPLLPNIKLLLIFTLPVLVLKRLAPFKLQVVALAGKFCQVPLLLKN